MSSASARFPDAHQAKSLTDMLQTKLRIPATSPEFDFQSAVETPLGTYQGMTDQVILSRTPGAFRTVLVPRGSSKPEWLSL